MSTATIGQGFVALLARVLLSAIFVLSGVNKIMDWSGTEGYMESKEMPLVPLLHVGAIVFELGGGLLVLSGFKARWGAVALILFIIPATLIFHNFWAVPETQRQEQMINFLKNVAILGGLLMVVAFGPGGFSLDRRLSAR
jgi:putative oxidoreductase